MITFETFKVYAYKKFRGFPHPNFAAKDLEFVKEISTWYEKIFAEKMKYSTCGVCLYEKFREMADLQQKLIDERLNLPFVLKENVVFWHKGQPYSRKSPHITRKIVEEIQELSPEKVEKNPYFVAKAPVKDEIISKNTEETPVKHVKQRRKRK